MPRFRLYQTYQPPQSSSDRTNKLRAETLYSSTVNIVQNGGVLRKPDGNVYTGPVYVGRQSADASFCLIHADSHKDLLDVTKGKYLQTPPQEAFVFEPKNIYDAPFTEFSYNDIYPVLELSGGDVTNLINYPPPSIGMPTASGEIIPNDTPLVVDPCYSLFYAPGEVHNPCHEEHGLAYLRFVDLSYSYTYDAKQIVRNEELKGFQYPSTFTFDCCNSKITL